MATITFRVSDETKRRMNEHDDINWSAVLRRKLEETLEERDRRDLGQAVAVTERVFHSIDSDLVQEYDSTDIIRQYRDRSHNPNT